MTSTNSTTRIDIEAIKKMMPLKRPTPIKLRVTKSMMSKLRNCNQESDEKIDSIASFYGVRVVDDLPGNDDRYEFEYA